MTFKIYHSLQDICYSIKNLLSIYKLFFIKLEKFEIIKNEPPINRVQYNRYGDPAGTRTQNKALGGLRNIQFYYEIIRFL